MQEGAEKEVNIMSKGNPSVHLRLEQEVLTKISALSKARGISTAAFIRMIVYAWLEECN